MMVLDKKGNLNKLYADGSVKTIGGDYDNIYDFTIESIVPRHNRIATSNVQNFNIDGDKHIDLIITNNIKHLDFIHSEITLVRHKLYYYIGYDGYLYFSKLLFESQYLYNIPNSDILYEKTNNKEWIKVKCFNVNGNKYNLIGLQKFQIKRLRNGFQFSILYKNQNYVLIEFSKIHNYCVVSTFHNVTDFIFTIHLSLYDVLLVLEGDVFGITTRERRKLTNFGNINRIFFSKEFEKSPLFCVTTHNIIKHLIQTKGPKYCELKTSVDLSKFPPCCQIWTGFCKKNHVKGHKMPHMFAKFIDGSYLSYSNGVYNEFKCDDYDFCTDELYNIPIKNAKYIIQ